MPIQRARCNVCGAKIGGKDYIIRSDNTENKGYWCKLYKKPLAGNILCFHAVVSSTYASLWAWTPHDDDPLHDIGRLQRMKPLCYLPFRRKLSLLA